MADELTVARAQARIARSMGWTGPKDWPSDMPVTELLNEVGEWFVSAEDWHFLTRPPKWLATVNGQAYCDLPADFTRCLDLVASTKMGLGIAPGDPTAVARAQAIGNGPSSSYVACFTFGAPTVAGPKAKCRLDLGPIPTVDVSQAFVLAYKGGWTRVSLATDHIVLPEYVTALYVRACCAWMAGLEQEKRGSIEDRLDRLVTSSLWQAAVDRDDTMQQDLGLVQGGVGTQFGYYSEDEWPFQRVQGVVPIGP